MYRIKLGLLASLFFVGAFFLGLVAYVNIAKLPELWILKSSGFDTGLGLVCAGISIIFLILAVVSSSALISKRFYLKLKGFYSELKNAKKIPAPITQAASSRKEQASAESRRAYEVGQNDPEGGLRILDKLLSHEPAAIGAYNVYGQLSMKLGDLVTARDAFESNIKASPNDDHRFDWAYLALIIGLQGDESKAREYAGRTGIKIQYDFADSVRRAYILWLREKGSMASRLPRTKK